MKNKYGLSRTIPSPIKRKVRQNSGFGCIFCGIWIYQYEHFNPDFKDAVIHDPRGICLLCGTDHQMVTSKLITKKQVKDQYHKPKALSKGYANVFLRLDTRFYVSLGRIFFTETGKLLEIEGKPLLSISQPTKKNPLQLNAKFYDDRSRLILEIKNNELRGFTTNWDIEQIGTRTTIRKAKGEIVLQINIIPPDVVEVEKINMSYGKSKIFTDSATGKIFIQSENGAIIDLSKGQIITEGLSIDEKGIRLDKALLIGVQEGLELGKMDFRNFIDNGQIRSEPLSKTKSAGRLDIKEKGV
jgi:hypothetical protein